MKTEKQKKQDWAHDAIHADRKCAKAWEHMEFKQFKKARKLLIEVQHHVNECLEFANEHDI